MSNRQDSSALDFLESLIEDTPKTERVARRERLRLELARFMKKAREAAGLTQNEVAKILGVTQAWVSKLESPNYDHKLESLLSYFDALGAEMNLSVGVAESTFEIWGTASTSMWGGVVSLSDFERLWVLAAKDIPEIDSLSSWVQDFHEEADTRSGGIALPQMAVEAYIQ